MWIECTNRTEEGNLVTRRMYDREIMGEDADPVEFNENGTARVPKDVGEALVEHVPHIRSKEDDD